jgi:cyanophycin synthetase
MRILETHMTRGPNCWSISHHRLIVLNIEITAGERDAVRNALHFIRETKVRLLEMFNDRFAGDFEEDLAGQFEGAVLIGYMSALIALKLQRQEGMGCSFKMARATDKPGITQAVFEYTDEYVGSLAAEAAVKIAGSLLKKEKYAVSNDVLAIQDYLDNTRSHPLTASIVEEAIRRKIPCIPLNKRQLIQLGYGASQKRIQKSATGQTSSTGVKIAGNKELSKELLRSLGIPVPVGKLIFRETALVNAIKGIGYPVVLKPASGNNGKGVCVDVKDYEAAVTAFQVAKSISGQAGVIVEKYITGSDYRLLVIGYKLVAAAKRTPAMVTGDGISTISGLIDRVNSDPRRGTGHSKPLTIIIVDEATRNILKQSGLSLDTVLPPGKRLFLKSIANLSAGGTSMDVTEMVHPDNVFMAERITRIIGLDICGMDIISPDIGVPFHLNGGTLIEVNSGPGFRLHMDPTEGKPRNVAGSVIDMLFPEGSPSRIPIIAVTGPYNKMIACDLIGSMMGKAGYKTGCATSAGIHIQNVMIMEEDATSYEHAELVLKDPTIDLAVFGCALPGILATGLAFHNCDTGIVIDLDTGGTEMTRAASVIPGCVLPSGYAILNADHETVYQMHKGLECKLAYFSTDEQNPYIIEHLKNGGHAAIVENGHITVCRGADKIWIIGRSDIPVTIWDDPSLIRNILAAVLVGLIYKIDRELIRGVLDIFIARYRE